MISGQDILALSIPEGPLVGKALAVADLFSDEASEEDILRFIEKAYEDPNGVLVTETEEDRVWVEAVRDFTEAVRENRRRQKRIDRMSPLGKPKEFEEFGSSLIPGNAREQMKQAMQIPVARKGALMADAHLGYGLPVGGAWALENAVSPNAVGVDIGCRMKLTVFHKPADIYDQEELKKALVENTHFGMGSGSDDLNHSETDHPVFYNRSWKDIPWLQDLKDKARYQLGSSGGGNHFVNWCTFTPELDFTEGPMEILEPGREYLALMSHSGSRGLGYKIAKRYREIAEERCWPLDPPYKKLAWLSLDSQEGQEYWNAMQLAGRYASACHEVIHKEVAPSAPYISIENHHNFAWAQKVDGQELIVHRKGATPARDREYGIVPGSMAHGGYVVEGKGNAASLESCSHGAGRKMSRTEAKNRLDEGSRNGLLKANTVELIGSGLDEHPRAYKDLDSVMSRQTELCSVVGEISNRIVRMA